MRRPGRYSGSEGAHGSEGTRGLVRSLRTPPPRPNRGLGPGPADPPKSPRLTTLVYRSAAFLRLPDAPRWPSCRPEQFQRGHARMQVPRWHGGPIRGGPTRTCTLGGKRPCSSLFAWPMSTCSLIVEDARFVGPDGAVYTGGTRYTCIPGAHLCHPASHTVLAPPMPTASASPPPYTLRTASDHHPDNS